MRSLLARNLRTGNERAREAAYFIEATELSDLLPITGTEFVTGCEGRAATGEPHMPERADAANQQAFTAGFVITSTCTRPRRATTTSTSLRWPR